jgi:LmbE family N-acetylglucosaminyl deacetylase
MIIFITIIISVLSSFVFLLWWINDFSLPRLNLFKYKKPSKLLTILAIFPHPDDETMPVGGTLASYAAQPDTNIIVLTTTHGDAGETNGVCSQQELASERAIELKNATDLLGVDQVILWDYPDGQVADHAQRLETQLHQTIIAIDPDVVITYDESGMYGHPDHIIVHKLVRKIVLSLPVIKLLYVTLPQRMLKHSNLPRTITLGDKVVDMNSEQLRQTAPTYKYSFWNLRSQKLKAIRAHRSQNIAKNLPLPFWLYGLIGWVEYFSEENNY